MKVEQIDALSEREAKELLLEFYNSPYCDVYFSIKSQIKKLSKEIENAQIDFKEDSAPFKNFVTWSEKSLTITSNLEQILAKIDTSILLELQERRVKAEDGSVESYIRKK
jgi:hypothetical protein